MSGDGTRELALAALWRTRRVRMMASARVTLRWTGILPVEADLDVAFMPQASFGTALLSKSVDVSGPSPLLTSVFRCDIPRTSRAEIAACHNVSQANPIVGIICLATVQDAQDLTVQLTLSGLLAAGTSSIVEIHTIVMTP